MAGVVGSARQQWTPGDARSVWNGQTVSVILPTYNERDSIRASIEEFFETGVVDEVLVINNNAAAGTSEEVARTAAREIIETRQGYGSAIQRGLKDAAGDLLILAEPDGTFVGRDIFKLLAYSDDFDVVFGTRTTSSLIGQGANMGLFLKWGNWAVAKMMEFLFDTTHLSDVGCTMRLFRRSELYRIQDGFTVAGSHFGPEMMLLVLERGLRYIEVPVRYRARVGESSVTGSYFKAFVLGLQMIWLILQHRLGLNGTGRTVGFLRSAGGLAQIGGAALLVGTLLLSVFFLLLGRGQPPALLDYPSPGLQLGLAASVMALGSVVFVSIRLTARRILAIDPEVRLSFPRPLNRRALGLAAGVSAALSLGLIALARDPDLSHWGSTVLGMLLAAFIALQAGGVLASVFGAVAGLGVFATRPETSLPGALALLTIWLVLRWEGDRTFIEALGALVGLAVAFVVEPVSAVGAAVMFLWIAGSRENEAMGRAGAGALAVAALIPMLLGMTWLTPSAEVFTPAISGYSGWLSTAVAVWFAAGPVETLVMLAGFLYLLMGWNERRSGLLARAAVTAFAFGILSPTDPAVTAQVLIALLSVGAALLAADGLRNVVLRTNPK